MGKDHDQSHPDSRNAAVGTLGEDAVVELLQRQGYAICERNWRPSGSHLEIDIIAQTGTTVAFVEVKTRSTDLNDPIDAITHDKMKKICRAADKYLQTRPYMFEYRMDIAGVTVRDGKVTAIDYIADAFMPPMR